MRNTQRWYQRHRTWLMLGGVLVLLFILINAAVALAYHGRTYPHTRVFGTDVSNMDFTAARTTLQHNDPLPASLQLAYKNRSTQIKPSELGMQVDLDKFSQVAKQGRTWLPLANFFIKHTLDAPLHFDQTTYNQAVEKLKPAFHQDVTGAHLVTQNGKITVAQATAGYQLDASKLQAALAKSVSSASTVIVPVSTLPPTKLANPDKALQAVQGQLNTALTFQYNGATAKASQADIASWYTQSGNNLVVSEGAVRAYITQTGAKLGVNPQNLDQATANTLDALKNSRSATIKLFAKVKTYTYCTAVRGISPSALAGFTQTVADVYANPKGWSLDGQVTFKHVDSGCDYTVWLSSAAEMHTFGAICDEVWDCNIGKNVVANDERWEHGTGSWNAAHPGGALGDYRTMLINHETGHQLGFYDSFVCAGPGQAAPIMLQQSIDLKGCVFNVWPLSSELAAVRPMIGL